MSKVWQETVRIEKGGYTVLFQSQREPVSSVQPCGVCVDNKVGRRVKGVSQVWQLVGSPHAAKYSQQTLQKTFQLMIIHSQ